MTNLELLLSYFEILDLTSWDDFANRPYYEWHKHGVLVPICETVNKTNLYDSILRTAIVAAQETKYYDVFATIKNDEAVLLDETSIGMFLNTQDCLIVKYKEKYGICIASLKNWNAEQKQMRNYLSE